LILQNNTNSLIKLNGSDATAYPYPSSIELITPITFIGKGATGMAPIGSTSGIYINGNTTISGTVNATSYNATSDHRIKENVLNLDESYSVDNLRPVKYTNKITGKEEFGLIAHELQEIYPYLVNEIKDGEKYQSINYIGLISLIINEIKILKNMIKTK
jgi:hypothetical protein